MAFKEQFALGLVSALFYTGHQGSKEGWIAPLSKGLVFCSMEGTMRTGTVRSVVRYLHKLRPLISPVYFFKSWHAGGRARRRFRGKAALSLVSMMLVLHSELAVFPPLPRPSWEPAWGLLEDVKITCFGSLWKQWQQQNLFSST